MDKRISKLSRQVRGLLVPRRNALLLAQADAARDARRWQDAHDLYRQFVALHPNRNGLLMQVGHCLKEMGFCREALAEYLAVSDEVDKVEADFQAGELLKLTGNHLAARWAYARSAARGHPEAAAELDYSARGNQRLQNDFFTTPIEDGEGAPRLLGRLLGLEAAPLDWRRLAAAAEDAAMHGDGEIAGLLGDLALIVGGPIAERQPLYNAIFGASGAWASRYGTQFGPTAFSSVKPAEGLARLAEALDFSVVPPVSDSLSATDPQQGEIALQVVEADGSTERATLRRAAAAAAAVRQELFDEAGRQGAGLVEAIAALAEALPARGRPIYAALPQQGAYSLAAIATRVCLNVAAVVADRLAAPLRTAASSPAAVAAAFAVPTQRATLATCAARDFVPAAILTDDGDEESDNRQRLSELIALGLLPGGDDDAPQRLLTLADQGRQAPLAYWFATIAPTALPSQVGEVCIHLANALKRRGAVDAALLWTERAAAAMPGRYGTDLGIQRKTSGDFAGAAEAFIAVLEREPDHESAAQELASVARECMEPQAIAALAEDHPGFGAVYWAAEADIRERLREASADNASGSLTAVLDIADLQDGVDFGPERLDCLQIGWLRSEIDGRSYPRLVGVVAIRLCLVTRDPPLRMRLRIDGRTIDIAEPSPSGVDAKGRGKYYVNSWIDTRELPRGPARLQAYVELRSSGYQAHEETVIIDDLRPGEDYGLSDAFVPAPGEAAPEATLTERVLALPATARASSRSAFDRPVERVLVMRLDQLGDLATSMPAIRRLRQIFPQARFEGLVTPVNAYILRASGLFDEVFTVDFTYDHGTRKRWLGRMAHAALRQRYAQTPVDIAIDLSPGEESRPVLTLINARYRAGFKPHRFGFLDFGIDLLTRDPVNRKEAVSHTAMIGAFVEALATMFAPPPPRFPADPALARHLAPLGLEPNGYIAIHVGARLAIKRWPLGHYVALAGLLRAETGREIVMFSDDPVPADRMAQIEAIGGIQVKAGRTEFEVFDALVSHAAVFIGNDTGPKHLASMRGVRTVGVHMDQVNWNEWGQDGEGLIVSKRIPCCGCGIEDPSECGKAMACLDGLSPREVADAVGRVLGRAKSPAATTA
ncbi:MAG TPA: glycosyltransferase family 9 protein [Bosea sp. (in: a-proteobacteria)]|uniref:glycosyltransferase family 9 protein n=1 Tax=Bosea sp. (in: a-proteobacteria) TaxID=1871050 RepID=UPI002E0E64D6|nr:glycosyltransferase family 9 protein [Bosea sp. (in: a-proteobacteria)]